MNVTKGTPADIDSWMALVEEIRSDLPGLETQERMSAHRATVLRFMDEGRALCVKADGRIAGVLLLSARRNMICCLAVAPEYRRRGIGAALVEKALALLDRRYPVTVSTFREDDPKGAAPRALYRRFGFEPADLQAEFDYPEQRFVLAAREVRA